MILDYHVVIVMSENHVLYVNMLNMKECVIKDVKESMLEEIIYSMMIIYVSVKFGR